MICTALTAIGLDERALVHGASMAEFPFIREQSFNELLITHNGKDASIEHMLDGGNGFPLHDYGPVSGVVFDCACTIERRDLRAVLQWSQDYGLCVRDKRRGATA